MIQEVCKESREVPLERYVRAFGEVCSLKEIVTKLPKVEVSGAVQQWEMGGNIPVLKVDARHDEIFGHESRGQEASSRTSM